MTLEKNVAGRSCGVFLDLIVLREKSLKRKIENLCRKLSKIKNFLKQTF